MPSKKSRIEYDPIVKQFAARLRDRRQKAGLTQVELARRANLTLSYVGRLESIGASPGVDTANRLAVALNTNIHDLLPVSSPPDAIGSPRARARASLDQIFQRGDPDVIRAISVILSELASGPKSPTG